MLSCDVCRGCFFEWAQVSSGATNDLRQATNMARHMVMQCGLNDAQ
jgi:ATP-dependent Zn protease